MSGEREHVAPMRISDEGLDLIKHFEGFSSEVYTCSGGRETIGYGHVICKDEELPTPQPKDEAEELLREDCRIAEAAVLRQIRMPLSQNQFDALVSWVFNLGSGSLQASTLRRVINRGHGEAPHQMRRWVHAGGRKLAGLVRRRETEAALYAGVEVGGMSDWTTASGAGIGRLVMDLVLAVVGCAAFFYSHLARRAAGNTEKIDELDKRLYTQERLESQRPSKEDIADLRGEIKILYALLKQVRKPLGQIVRQALETRDEERR